MTHFEQLRKEIQDGIEGKGSGIPMGFPRLNSIVSIRKSTYYLLGGYTGSGKTSFIDDAFVLNPIDTYLLHPSSIETDFEIIYFSMERRKNFKLAKWLARRIFLDEGAIIPVSRLMGWVDKTIRLTPVELSLVDKYEWYIEEIMKKVTILEGPTNPTGIRNYVDAYALKNGKEDTSDKWNPIYHADNPNKVVLIIHDTVGLTKKEKNLPSKKDAIDKTSEDKQRFRDYYQFSPVDVSQFNRDIANINRLKNGEVEPMLEDFKDTGSTQENADVVFSLFDPHRYKVEDPSGYEIDKLRDSEGAKYYRQLKILKNSYGSDDVRIGLAFEPHVGHFKEMPKLNQCTERTYQEVIEKGYFMGRDSILALKRLTV
jgi:hypothetical protein